MAPSKFLKKHKLGFHDLINQILILKLLLSSKSFFEEKIRRSRFHRLFSPRTSSVYVGFDSKKDGWSLKTV